MADLCAMKVKTVQNNEFVVHNRFLILSSKLHIFYMCAKDYVIVLQVAYGLLIKNDVLILS